MAEILSQAEIDSLINSLVSEPQPGAGQGAGKGDGSQANKRVRTYDFRRPDRFSKDQLRTLQMLHENFTRLLTGVFSARFRTMVQMVVGSVDQATYAEYLRGVSNPSVIGVFSMQPWSGNCVIDIHPDVAFPMLDRLFGGPGNKLNQPRALTEIEVTVMQRLLQETLNCLRDAWSNISVVSPRLEVIENNPLFTQVVAPSEIVVTIAIDVRVGEHVGVITLCLPYLTLDPVLTRLSASTWFASNVREVTPEGQQQLQERVGSTPVTLTAELGRTTLTMGEILGLDVGDLVILDQRCDGEAQIYVGNRPKFTAEVGVVRGRLAMEIVDLLPTTGDDET